MAITLPQLLSQDGVFNRYQNLLSTALRPLTNSALATATPVTISSTSSNGTVTMSGDIQLLAASNPNIIQLGSILSGPLQGWVITRIKGQATIWDSQDSNPSPSQNSQNNNQTTLLLNTSADVVVNLSVF